MAPDGRGARPHRGDRRADHLRRLVRAGWTLLASGLCDVFDGSVARHRGQQKRSGAFMDSVDRVSDAILFSCLFWALAEDGRELDAALALFTLVVSLSVSHIGPRPRPWASRSPRASSSGSNASSR